MGTLADWKNSVSSTITTGGELTALEHVALLHSLGDILIAQVDPDDDGLVNITRLQGLENTTSKYVGTNASGDRGVFDLPTLTLTQTEFNSLLSNAGPTLVTTYASQVPLMSTPELEAGTETAQRRVSPELLKAMIDFHATAAGINSFQTISTPSGTDPVADSSTDTLQLLIDATHGNGLLDITGNATGDSVTFAFNLSALTQETSVDTANDLFLMWDSSAGAFRAVKGEDLPGIGGTLDINGLTQETTFTPTADEIAVYDASANANRKFLYSDIRKWVEVSFNTTLTFDRNKSYTSHTQTGDITFSLAGSGNVPGTTIKAVIVSDGTNVFNFPSGSTLYGATDGQAIAAGTYEIWFFYNPDGTLSITVPGISSGNNSPTGAAGGDLAGTYPNPTVDGLQGRSVANIAPTDRQGLLWDNGSTQWEPGDIWLHSSFSTAINDPGTNNNVAITYDRLSGITTYNMGTFTSANIGLSVTGLLNNHGIAITFDAQNTTASINPAAITINGFVNINFTNGFNWTSGFGTTGQRYLMIIEIVSNVAVVDIQPIGNAVT